MTAGVCKSLLVIRCKQVLLKVEIVIKRVAKRSLSKSKRILTNKKNVAL